MPIRSGDRAPYGPPAAVLAVINGFRNRGLSTPFTNDVLLRAGVSESLVPRTLKSLEALDLIDESGTPTPLLDGLRRASTDEFPARLADVVRQVYAEVFQFADPATDDSNRIADAFRAYEPIGQRARMVTLFLGLCQAAGILTETAPVRKAATANQSRSSARQNAPARKPSQTAPSSRIAPSERGATVFSQASHEFSGLPPALAGLLAMLPPSGSNWTKAKRDAFVTAFESALDFSIPIRGEDTGTDSSTGLE